MSQNTTATQPRTVQAADRGKLDVRALVLLAILLAAGFILNFTVGQKDGLSGRGCHCCLAHSTRT